MIVPCSFKQEKEEIKAWARAYIAAVSPEWMPDIADVASGFVNATAEYMDNIARSLPNMTECAHKPSIPRAQPACAGLQLTTAVAVCASVRRLESMAGMGPVAVEVEEDFFAEDSKGL